MFLIQDQMQKCRSRDADELRASDADELQASSSLIIVDIDLMQHVQKVDKMCFRLKFSHLPHHLFQGGSLLLEEVSFHSANPNPN